MSVLLVLVTATVAPVAAQTEAEPITVLAEKLKRVRISPGVTIRNGAVIMGQCKIKRSSGVAEIDAVACDAVRICASRPQVNRKSFNTCVQQEGEDGMYRLIAERQQRQSGEAM